MLGVEIHRRSVEPKDYILMKDGQTPVTMLSLIRFLDAINQRHGTTFRLVRRYERGEQGAFALEDGAGRSYVLKRPAYAGYLDGVRVAVMVTDALRDTGYPVPHFVLSGAIDGTAYAIREALPGVPMGDVTAEILPRLLALNAMQHGRGLPSVVAAAHVRRDWPMPVVETVLAGGDGYCLLPSLRSYSHATATLLDQLQEIVARHRDEPCARDDVVHWDFQGTNILVEGDRVSGVVDWEGACVGDRAFDLVTLLYYAYAAPDTQRVRAVLWRQAREQAAAGVLAMYLAHMILRQVDWSIRFYDAAVVARYLQASEDALRDAAG